MACCGGIPYKALIILVVGLVIGVGVGAKYGHKITWLTAEKTLNTKTVADAVNKPTTSTTNNTQLNIDKIKGSGSPKIVLDSKNDQTASTLIQNKDSCVDITGLNKSQLRRLERWLSDK